MDNTPNQSSKCRINIQVKVDDDAHGRYNTNSQIKLKLQYLKSGL